jgi:hypothetical protein
MGLWVADKSIDAPGLRGRIEATVREALAALAAHRDGRLCGDPHPIPNEYGWSCLRPAGHTDLDGWRALHAMSSGHLWTTEGMVPR